MLNGWKAIAAYLQRDERTAMRWAVERGLPVHRMPGHGRGSVYAIADEIDAWLEADRARIAASSRTVPMTIDPTEPPIVRVSSVPWWRRHWVASALVSLGALLIGFGALTLHLSRSENTVPNIGVSDPVTKGMFLQANYDWNLRTPYSLSRAAQEYSNTIGRDPRIPVAYVGLANSYLLLREYGSLPDADAYGRAEAAARAAIALSPTCAEAHRALAFISFWWQNDRITARSEFKQALALKPNDPLTHHWLANALLANGEANEALHEIDRARELDPVSTSIVADRATILYFAGHRAEGLASLHDLAREQPEAVSPHRTMADIALFEGKRAEFLREAATMARLRSDTSGLAEVERWRSVGTSTKVMEEAMLHDAKAAGAGWFRIAKLSSLAGRQKDAKDALVRACDAHEPATISAPIDLWLSRALSSADIAERCGRATPLS